MMVSSSIVLYNTKKDIEEIIKIVFQSPITKLFLIDHSKIKSLDLKLLNSKTEYIHNPLNPGYGAGHNMAIKRIINKSKYHFVLNPDISFNPDDVQIIIDYMEKDPDVGLVMPRVVYPDGSL